MDETRYQELVTFLESPSGSRTWPSWVIRETDQKKRKMMKCNFRALAVGTAQRAGFTVQSGSLYKKVFKNRKAKTFSSPRLVIKAKDVKEMLKGVHDEAGHVGVNNTQRNCIRDGSLKIWWKGINVDIREYNKKCPSCIQSGPPPAKSGELQSIVPPKKAFSFWGMDHKNVAVETSSGNK